MDKMKIGLLPHYLELYDKKCADRRVGMEDFLALIAGEFRRRGYDVVEGRICRLSAEFAEEVRAFEKAGAEAVVSLHLAYSPSLESIEALSMTKLPLVVLDTTPDFDFSPGIDPSRIMFNHGIHGVQDICNMLLRRGKPFLIEAGHWKRSDLFERAGAALSAARMASKMRNSRTGLVGTPFEGMGDFAVPFEEMKRHIGMAVVPFDFKKTKRILDSISRHEVEAEMAQDKKRFASGKFTEDEHRAASTASLAVRKWLDENKLSSFSMNFMDCAGKGRFPTVPFLEASKAMSRGIGYAGEGDVLTASLVGALKSHNPETTFTEMFCPDWKGNRIFLSHMGEVDLALLEGRPSLLKCGFPIEGSVPPLFAAGRLRPGAATLVNLAPSAGGSYTLIAAPVNVEKAAGDKFNGSVRAWIRPEMEVGKFLAEYSRSGGTHHLAMAYGCPTKVLADFAHLMGWRYVNVI